MSTQQLIHAIIEHYSIERHLARGGMADVFLARDQQRGDEVAIKIVLQGLGEQSERFLREAQAMTTLHHPHILPGLSSGAYENWYYLVMPYMAHGSLHDLLLRGPLPLTQVDVLLRQIVDAVHFAHERGILHRDIKASNILLRDPMYAYLADFGLVKSTSDDYSLTRTGFLLGTPEYMAPELMEGEVSPLSDIYALGVLLYQMVTGTLPFKAQTPMALMLKHLRELPPPPQTVNAMLPAAIEPVLSCALAKDPQQRFQSASALAEAFHQAIQPAVPTIVGAPPLIIGTSNAAAPSLRTLSDSDAFVPQQERYAAATVQQFGGFQSAQPERIQFPQKKRRLVFVALAILLCLGITLAFAFSGNGSSSAPSAIPTPAATVSAQDFTPTVEPTPTSLDSHPGKKHPKNQEQNNNNNND
jgi:Serine/threonine protein kinase